MRLKSPGYFAKKVAQSKGCIARKQLHIAFNYRLHHGTLQLGRKIAVYFGTHLMSSSLKIFITHQKKFPRSAV